MKQSILRVALGALVAISLPASAASLTAWLTNTLISPMGGATNIDFGTSLSTNNSGPVQNPLTTFSNGIATYSGGELFNTSNAGVSGVSARPVGSTGNWWSIQAGQTGTVNFSSGISYYGFLWGSPDVSPWNDVRFYSGNTLLASYGREDFQPPLTNNNWTTTSYLNVSILNGGPLISKITFTASQNAFETDNHAYLSAVPLPPAFALMLPALAMFGFLTGRNRKNVV